MAAPVKPQPRTLRIDLPAPYEGFYAVARLDFPARVLTELQSGDFERQLAAFDRIVIEHNFTDTDGQTPTSLAEVDPWKMVELSMQVWGAELGK